MHKKTAVSILEKRYAKALFSIAAEKADKLDIVKRDLGLFQRVISENVDIQRIFQSTLALKKEQFRVASLILEEIKASHCGNRAQSCPPRRPGLWRRLLFLRSLPFRPPCLRRAAYLAPCLLPPCGLKVVATVV